VKCALLGHDHGMRRRRAKTSVARAPIADDFVEWVSNMPYVVERSEGVSSPVRIYDIDCEPLGQRSRWLILEYAPDIPTPMGISVLLPPRLADKAARAGWGRSHSHNVRGSDATDRDRPVVFRIDARAERRHIEDVVMGAYRVLVNWA